MGVKIVIAFLFLANLLGYTQTDSITNSYHKEYKEKMSLQLFGLNTSNKFNFIYNENNLEIELIPNQKTTIGLAFKYDFLAFSFGFAPHFLAENRDNENSKMFSFGTDFVLKKVVQHINFFYQKGIQAEASNGNTVYFEKLKTIKLGGTTTYLFNPNFSYNALNFQNARQIKSVGTFGASLDYYFTTLDGRKQQQLNSKYDAFDVTIGPSYLYNWVIANYILVAPEVSFGMGFTKYKDDNLKNISVLYKAGLNLTLGYNSDNLYGGIKTRSIALNHKSEGNVDMSDNINFTSIFLGYRFDASNSIKKQINKLKF
ncbi:DUF4421 family protein [Flavobacterium chuncheonense]|uniref:DUF4421 family protein n=1 Tax=Flavobacterium chuncheonense TaxID=2026653 RepID=A0ABW5YMP9_9FLAO